MSCSACGSVGNIICPMCGRLVCRQHFNSERGLCIVCVEALCMICGARLSITRCIYCGKLGCDSCLVQVDNVRRACRDCLRSRAIRVQEVLRELERLKNFTYKLLRA